MWFVSAQVILCPLVRFYSFFSPVINSVPKFVNVDAVFDGAAPSLVFLALIRVCYVEKAR